MYAEPSTKEASRSDTVTSADTATQLPCYASAPETKEEVTETEQIGGFKVFPKDEENGLLGNAVIKHM